MFYESKSEYYGMCPGSTKSTCGLQNNYDKTVIYAHTEKETFSFDRLRYKTANYKIPTYGVCSYTVKNPVGGYTGGKVYIKIAKLDEGGVTLYISSDGAVKDTTISTLTHDVYSIDNGKEFTISAVP